MRTKAVLQQHDHGYAARIKKEYDNQATKSAVRIYPHRRMKRNGCFRAKIPQDGEVIHVSKKRVVTHCPGDPDKARKRRMRARRWRRDKKQPKLTIAKDEKVVAVDSKLVFVEKRKRKKKATRLRTYILQEANGHGDFDCCFTVQLPAKAKIVAVTRRKVTARLPKSPGKNKKRKLVAVPLVDKGRISGVRYYTASIPKHGKVVAVSSKGLLFVRVKKKGKWKAEEKTFAGVADEGAIPKGRNIGVLKHRKLGFGPTYLLSD